MELTRRALLQGALTAGALVRLDPVRFTVAVQDVSAVTVRVLFLPLSG